jgi:hypothetical protein
MRFEPVLATAKRPGGELVAILALGPKRAASDQTI